MSKSGLASELSSLLSEAAAVARETSDDERLTRQLIATARAMNIVVTDREAVAESSKPEVSVEVPAPTLEAAEQPTVLATDLLAEVAVEAGSIDASSTLAEEIHAVTDVESVSLAGSAIAAVVQEITAITELVSTALAASSPSAERGDDGKSSGWPPPEFPAEAASLEDVEAPAMAARLAWSAERSGFDTVRPPVRPIATDDLISEEANLDRTQEHLEPTPTVDVMSADEDVLVRSHDEPAATFEDEASVTPVGGVGIEPKAIESLDVTPNVESPESESFAAAFVEVAAEPFVPATEPQAIEDPGAELPPLEEAVAAAPEAAVVETNSIPESVELPPANESTEAIAENPVAESPVEKPQVAVAEVASAPLAVAATVTAIKTTASTVLAPAVRDEYNRTNIDFRRPWPRPKVRGKVIDFHCHLLARRHAEDWFEAADHYGMDCFVTMSPLEEAVTLARDWGHRLRFIAVPKWGDNTTSWVDQWLNRIESFYNLGSRIAKFHAAPGTMATRGYRLDAPVFKPLIAEVKARGMAIMTHIGDPDTWYNGHYTDTAKFGTRDEHYAMWEGLLEEHRGHTWIGAHMGGNPEDLPRLQRLLDKYPDLWLDCSATRWMIREISARREPAREFFIRNADRILFGSDQVSGDDRQFDFLASRIWCHRKLWETAYIGESPIIDPDVPQDQQPTIRGLALPDAVLQRIYHDNATKLLERLGMAFS